MISLAMFLSFTLLAGCSTREDPEQATNNEPADAVTIDLASRYDLSVVDKITIRYFGSIDEPSFEITDSADIEKMIKAVDFALWQETEVAAADTIYHIEFGDEIIISFSTRTSKGQPLYGSIEQYESDENGDLVAVDPSEGTLMKYYNMPYGIYTTLQEMIEKYAPELLSE